MDEPQKELQLLKYQNSRMRLLFKELVTLLNKLDEEAGDITYKHSSGETVTLRELTEIREIIEKCKEWTDG